MSFSVRIKLLPHDKFSNVEVYHCKDVGILNLPFGVFVSINSLSGNMCESVCFHTHAAFFMHMLILLLRMKGLRNW